MINLGIIGTGMISRNFVATAEKTNEFNFRNQGLCEDN